MNLKKAENEVIHKNDLMYKSKMYQKQRRFEENLKDTTAKRLPFNEKVNQKSKSEAWLYATGKIKSSLARQTQSSAYHIPEEPEHNEDIGEMDLLAEDPAGDAIEEKLEMEG